MLTVMFDLVGTRPMLQHNGRLANPIDPITRQIQALATKRKKTDEDYRVLLPLEAYGGCWETEDGRLGLPTENVWSCLYTAAKAFKLGEDIKRALSFDGGEVAPLRVDGKEVNAKEYVYDEGGRGLFIRTVVINKRRCLRARPIIYAWQSTHAFTLLDDILNPDALAPVLERAGRLVGIGDWRPLYGRFTVQNVTATRESLAA